MSDEKPVDWSLSKRWVWLMVSEAFDKSRKTAPIISPLSIFPKMVSVKWAKAISVANFGRKLNCFGVIVFGSLLDRSKLASGLLFTKSC